MQEIVGVWTLVRSVFAWCTGDTAAGEQSDEAGTVLAANGTQLNIGRLGLNTR